MNSVVYVDSNLKKSYKSNSFWSKLKDRFHTRYEGATFIKEFNTVIYRVKLPPNMHKEAFKRNLYTIQKRFNKELNSSIALNTYRYLDYPYYSEFQKNFLGYSVRKSIQLILMTRNKSIKRDCIAVYDAADEINRHIIIELSKKSKCLILVSNNIKRIRVLCEYIISNYGISPIITDDINYAANHCDFIVTSRPLVENPRCPMWCLDNLYNPQNPKDIIINEVTFKPPWDLNNLEFTFELVSGIFNASNEKNIGKLLYNNGIVVDEVKFKRNHISLTGK